jgi:hypothetical protein
MLHMKKSEKEGPLMPRASAAYGAPGTALLPKGGPGANGRSADPRAEDIGHEFAAPSPGSEHAIRNINFFLNAADHQSLRVHAIKQNRSLQSIMAEALNLYLSKHKLPPIELVKAYRR